MRKLILELESTNITIIDGKVRIEVEDESKIRLIPDGMYKGRNWFNPLILTSIKELVLKRFKEIENEVN